MSDRIIFELVGDPDFRAVDFSVYAGGGKMLHSLARAIANGTVKEVRVIAETNSREQKTYKPALLGDG